MSIGVRCCETILLRLWDLDRIAGKWGNAIIGDLLLLLLIIINFSKAVLMSLLSRREMDSGTKCEGFLGGGEGNRRSSRSSGRSCGCCRCCHDPSRGSTDRFAKRKPSVPISIVGAESIKIRIKSVTDVVVGLLRVSSSIKPDTNPIVIVVAKWPAKTINFI